MAVVALATLLIAIDSLSTGEVIAFHPEHQMLPGIVALLLPIVVWRGKKRFGASFPWTLPVDRWRHALAKVFAGWVSLMGVVALFLLWSLAPTLLSGGNILAEETLRVLRAFSFTALGHARPCGRGDRPLDAGTPALAGPLHLGNRNVSQRARAPAAVPV
jgi:hypothetical protein